ncbi:LysE family translocator [Parasphingorhabdus sp.]
MTPGPATMVTVSHALPAGREGGMRGALGPMIGVNIGNFIWYALTAFGLIAIIQAFPLAYAALRWIGVAYLIWMGIGMLRSTGARLSGASATRAGFRKGFFNGLAVHMSNPKALLFYTAIIPPFIDSDGNLWLQFAILAGLTVITETTGLTFYAAIASRLRNLKKVGDPQRMFQNIAGIILILAALVLAWWNYVDMETTILVFNILQGQLV